MSSVSSANEYLSEYLGSFQVGDRPKRRLQRLLKSEVSLKLIKKRSDKVVVVRTPSEESVYLAEVKKSTNRYSHIQAKVNCHRQRAERVTSPGYLVFGKSAKSYEVKSKVDSLSNIKYVPGGGGTKVFTEKLTFRKKAEPRTDTHGIEMYAHLPEEFQEIARRLARQDSHLKRRGRSNSRSSSFAVSSRQSSTSPPRGRSRTRKPNRRITPGNSISDIFADVNSTKIIIGSPIKQRPVLSRSSSIRSIPSTPHLCKQHPATQIRHEKSPSASPARSPGRIENKTLFNATSNPVSGLTRGKLLKSSFEQMPSPVMKLYQFTTQNDSFGSPNCL